MVYLQVLQRGICPERLGVRGIPAHIDKNGIFQIPESRIRLFSGTQGGEGQSERVDITVPNAFPLGKVWMSSYSQQSQEDETKSKWHFLYHFEGLTH